MMKKIVKDNAGLTLIELMIVLTLSLILMGAAYMSYQVQHLNSIAQKRVMTVQQDIRAVMDIIEKDIRNAGCDPKQVDIIGISSTSGVFSSPDVTKLGLVQDLDGDSDTTGIDEIIGYEWGHTSKQLTRNNQVLAEKITELTIKYYSSSGIDITPSTGSQLGSDRSRVKTIEIALEVQSENQDPETKRYITRKFTRKVDGRNFGL